MSMREELSGRGLRLLLRAGLLLACALLTGCAGAQSVLDPAGPQAARIDKIWWLFFYVSVAVLTLVTVFLFLAIYQGRWHREGAGDDAPLVEGREDAAPDPHRERRMTRTVTVATIITTITLIVLTVASFSIGRSLTSSLSNEDAVTIELTGQQWWWQVRYDYADPSQSFITANEIHVPVGQPVTIKLKSTDVIHSFWVPNLVGKKDMIPGHDAVIWFQADKPGLFRGQCAEYCGLQHAHMALWVVAETPDKYQAWLEGQRGAAHQPATDSEGRGQAVFLNTTCVMCHTIQGTRAGATIGPNLTHVASRSSIAAGTLPNTRGHLSGWVVDPQGIKPGTRMPPNPLKADDLQALLDYLQSLK
jgi:cytochrome c oxidase subunit 2